MGGKFSSLSARKNLYLFMFLCQNHPTPVSVAILPTTSKICVSTAGSPSRDAPVRMNMNKNIWKQRTVNVS